VPSSKLRSFVVLLGCLVQCSKAQIPDTEGIPWRVKFVGKLSSSARLEDSRSDRYELIQISIYEYESSRLPLYEESQTVHIGSGGEFVVLVGLPERRAEFESLLQSGRAKWIGVRGEFGERELRSSFVAVPYSFKAKDAEALDGLKPSDFVLGTELRSKVLSVIREDPDILAGKVDGGMAYRYPDDRYLLYWPIPRADRFPGTNACSKINAAIKSTDLAGGIVDATGFSGVQPCSTDMFADIGQRGGEIWFSQANFQVTVEQNWPSNWRLRGMPGGPGKGTWFTWKGESGKSIFRLNTVRWTLMDGFNLDCSNVSGMTGLTLWTNYSSQHTRFENFSVLNCPTAVQWGDTGVGSSLNQADRVEFRHFDISAPVIQTTARGFVIDSSNSGQTSVIEDGQIANVNIGIDIPHLESGIFSVKRVQCNLKGDDAAFIRLGEVYDIHIEKTQCENNGRVGANPSHLLVLGSNNLTASITLIGNTINFPVRVIPARSIVSIGNNGISSGYLFHPLTTVTSIGDRMGSSYGDINWVEPSVNLTNAQVVRANGIVTVELLPVAIASITRAGNYSTVTTMKAHLLGIGQTFTISGSSNGSFNGSGRVCSNPPICPAPTDLSFTFEDFGTNDNSVGGSVQPLHGFSNGALLSVSGMGDSTLNSSRAVIQVSDARSFHYQSSGGDLTATTGGNARTSANLVTSDPSRQARLPITLAPSEQRRTVLSWPRPFSNSAYTVNCTIVAAKIGQVRFDLISISASEVQVAFTNLDNVATSSATLHCAATQDSI
jgi:hypothetical protein